MSSPVEPSTTDHKSENDSTIDMNINENNEINSSRKLSSITTDMMRNMTWIRPRNEAEDLIANDIRFCPKCVSDVVPKKELKRPKGAMKKAACLSCSSVCCLGLPWLCGICIWPFVCPGFKESAFYCPNCNKRLFE